MYGSDAGRIEVSGTKRLKAFEWQKARLIVPDVPFGRAGTSQSGVRYRSQSSSSLKLASMLLAFTSYAA
jgi:hypothetical protein